MTPETGKQTITINIAWYLKKQRQSETNIWSVNSEKYFFFKDHAENETGRLVTDLLLIFKKA